MYIQYLKKARKNKNIFLFKYLPILNLKLNSVKNVNFERNNNYIQILYRHF